MDALASGNWVSAFCLGLSPSHGIPLWLNDVLWEIVRAAISSLVCWSMPGVSHLSTKLRRKGGDLSAVGFVSLKSLSAQVGEVLALVCTGRSESPGAPSMVYYCFATQLARNFAISLFSV